MAPDDRVRVIRVLEYVGGREWVEDTLTRRSVAGTWSCPNGTIREAVVGDFPEVVNPPAKPEPILPCPECGASTFRTVGDRDRHMLKCRIDENPVPLAEWPCSENDHTREHRFDGEGVCEHCHGHMQQPVNGERVRRDGYRLRLAASLRRRVAAMTGTSEGKHGEARALIDLADELEQT